MLVLFKVAVKLPKNRIPTIAAKPNTIQVAMRRPDATTVLPSETKLVLNIAVNTIAPVDKVVIKPDQDRAISIALFFESNLFFHLAF